jgi:hypothetical protein
LVNPAPLKHSRALNEAEPFPDASRDNSSLKLKSNKDFWAVVQSLPKN